jgi:hypothetical protein
MPDWAAYLSPLIFTVLILITVIRDRKFSTRIENVKQSIEAQASNKDRNNV